LGVLSREDAIAKAQELGLDLIEVASNATPPVARILDYQKFKFDEQKKERAARKHAKDVDQKEFWLSPRIAEHDLMVRVRRGEEFIKGGDKVKFTVKFRGREMGHPELGHAVLKQVLDYFGDLVQVERDPRFEGRNLSVIIGQSKGTKKNAEVKNEQVIS
jgi:translation initiation factor IF-3